MSQVKQQSELIKRSHLENKITLEDTKLLKIRHVTFIEALHTKQEKYAASHFFSEYINQSQRTNTCLEQCETFCDLCRFTIL